MWEIHSSFLPLTEVELVQCCVSYKAICTYIHLLSQILFLDYYKMLTIVTYAMKGPNLVDYLSFTSVQSLSHVQLFATPWTAAHQASPSITNSQSLLRLKSMESVMPSPPLILCRPVSSRLLSAPCIHWAQAPDLSLPHWNAARGFPSCEHLLGHVFSFTPQGGRTAELLESPYVALRGVRSHVIKICLEGNMIRGNLRVLPKVSPLPWWLRR